MLPRGRIGIARRTRSSHILTHLAAAACPGSVGMLARVVGLSGCLASCARGGYSTVLGARVLRASSGAITLPVSAPLPRRCSSIYHQVRCCDVAGRLLEADLNNKIPLSLSTSSMTNKCTTSTMHMNANSKLAQALHGMQHASGHHMSMSMYGTHIHP